jgi:hypothetical protein
VIMDTSKVQELLDQHEALVGYKASARDEIDAAVAQAEIGEMPPAFSKLSLKGEFYDMQDEHVLQALGQAILDACDAQAREGAAEAAALKAGELGAAYKLRDELNTQSRQASMGHDRSPEAITNATNILAELQHVRGTITVLFEQQTAAENRARAARDARKRYSPMIDGGAVVRAARIFLDGGRDFAAEEARRAKIEFDRQERVRRGSY